MNAARLTGGAVAALAAMLAVATPIVSKWEGKSNDPYLDIVKVKTVCYGETNVPMRRYTDAECTAMLQKSLGGYGEAVIKRNPNLQYRPFQWAAATSLSYNIGNGAYAGSTVAKRFQAGDFKGACDGFLAWRYAGGREVVGLKRRREDERQLCLLGL